MPTGQGHWLLEEASLGLFRAPFIDLFGMTYKKNGTAYSNGMHPLSQRQRNPSVYAVSDGAPLFSVAFQ